jgi:hypothetical protein
MLKRPPATSPIDGSVAVRGMQKQGGWTPRPAQPMAKPTRPTAAGAISTYAIWAARTR